MDVPVELSVEIGRRVMRLGEILKLGPDSVLELDKLSGEPLDIYANKKLVARGEAGGLGRRSGGGRGHRRALRRALEGSAGRGRSEAEPPMKTPRHQISGRAHRSMHAMRRL